MNKILKSIILIIILVITLCSFIYYFDPILFNTLVKEDGIIENITAFMLLISSLFLFIRFIKIGRLKNKLWNIFNILLILGLLFGFGEEISWGQRIFSIESNNFFSTNNLQGETNLHNLKLLGLKVNIVVFTYAFGLIFTFYIFFATFLFRKNNFFENIVNKIGIPLPKPQHSIFFVFATIIITTVPHPRIWELWECFNVLLLFLILIEPFNISEIFLPAKNN
jgi:hypothetical protein